MKKIKVYVLQNSRKDYARFDVYGWDSTTFTYATKFFTLSEAKHNAKLVNYITACPDNCFKAVKKIVKIKS